MNRFTTMALAAGTLALATGSVAQAEMVQFNYTWYGYAPGNPDVTEWGMSHISDMTITDYNALLLYGETIEFQLDIGGQQVPVEFVDGVSVTYGDNYPESFEMATIIENVPNYGPMQIVIGGTGTYHPLLNTWEGTVAIIWGPPGNPFGAPVTQNGIWSAQVVPAPGVVALFGLAGLTGRRRRD